jgi:hypothetical protein
MGGARSTHGRDNNAYNNLVRKPEEKRPLGRPRHRWEDSIGMDLREIASENLKWVNLAKDRD